MLMDFRKEPEAFGLFIFAPADASRRLKSVNPVAAGISPPRGLPVAGGLRKLSPSLDLMSSLRLVV